MPVLNVEHVACNVAEPVAMAAWYVEHLGMRIVRKKWTRRTSISSRTRAVAR